ncbi:MAG TPA: ABC transporter permease [Vicinamibacterales bacterium]|jgi:cell division transport system permease protein|nr:ABC transporter permease [Vicinamibacterales bacterium]
MRAVTYFFQEGFASLVRSWRPAIVSIATIAAGLFVLGFFLMVNTNLQRIVSGWTDAAELAVYLRDDATSDQTATVKTMIDQSGLASRVRYASKDDARRQFGEDFPDLAPAAGALDRNPFPASFEVRLNGDAQDATPAVDRMATALAAMPGVADVRYDRRWLERLEAVVKGIRGVGLVLVLLLACASALTVASVVRLAASARHDEIEIMQLVGAPISYIRGPLVVEGLLQGGLGAILAAACLLAVFAAVRARYAGLLHDAVGLTGVTFVPVQLLTVLIAGGMVLGCIGGFIVARTVR